MAAIIRYRDHAGSSASRNEVVMSVEVRIWIMGAEVSDYLIGDVSVERAPDGSEGTCSFSLDNNFDRFIVRPENLGGSTPEYRFDQGVSPADTDHLKTNIFARTAAEVPVDNIHWIEDNKNEKRCTFTFDEAPKRKIFEYKAQQMFEFANVTNAAQMTQYSTGGSTGGTPIMNTNQATWKLPKYDLTAGACIINLHDEVRAFIADPNQDPLSDDDRRWMPLFTGVITTVPVKHSRVQGSSDISISCADARYILKKMRVAGNFQSADQKKTYVHFDNAVGMFQDTIAASSDTNLKYENNLATLSYRQLTRAILCGDTQADISTLDITNGKFGQAEEPGNAIPEWSRLGGVDPYTNKATNAKEHKVDGNAQVRGVGNFSLGWELCYDSSKINATQHPYLERAKLFERWNDICLFGIKQDWYSDADIERIGGGTIPFELGSSYSELKLNGGQDTQMGKPAPYSVLNGFVHYLFPGPNTQSFGVRNAMERMLISPGSDVNWQNRLDILTQASETISYKFYVTPIGDFVFEFPMYDFMPNSFGKYAACYVVHDSVKDDEFNDEGDGNVCTGLIVRGGFQAIDDGAAKDAENQTAADQGFSLIVKSDYMAGKYGIAIEEYSIPWLNKIWPMETQGVDGSNIDKNTLMRNSLATFGVIEFYRRISAMSSASHSGIYNPFLLPNRPMLNKITRRIGLTTSCSISAPLDGAPTSSAQTMFVRKADHDGKFYTITGSENTTFSYTGDGLSLFSTTQLDGLRYNFGIEIIDPAQSMVFNAKDSLTATYPPYSGGGSQSEVRQRNSSRAFSVSPRVQQAFNNFEKLKQTNPKLYAQIVDAAAGSGMDPKILFQIMCFESGGGDHINPQGHNPLGAMGVIQFLPSTLKGMGINPDTFLHDYPTVESQLPLVKQYLSKLKGPLDSPYAAYMAIANPASLNDDMFTKWSDSSSSRTRKLAAQIQKGNNGATCGADFMMGLGYNYVNPEGGTFTKVSANGRKTTTKYTPAGNQATAATPAQSNATVAASPAGMKIAPSVPSSASSNAVSGVTKSSVLLPPLSGSTSSTTATPPPPVVKPSVLAKTTQAVKKAMMYNTATTSDGSALPNTMNGVHG